MFLHYEDMLAYPEEHIRKIADFTGIDCTSDIISKVSGAITSTVNFAVLLLFRLWLRQGHLLRRLGQWHVLVNAE